MKFYEKITKARTLLELPEEATRKQIKANYRRLIRKWHPDRCKKDLSVSQERTREIIEAYKLISNYCDNYKYSFSKKETGNYLSQEEWWMERFGPDPLWGKPGK